MEEWRNIEGFPGYMVSNEGRVKSFKRGKERILKTVIGKNGYEKLILHYEGKKYNKLMHILVFDAFGNGKRNGRILQIDHRNNCKTDNRIENLQLLDTRANSSKRSMQKEKTSKYTGVSWRKDIKKWAAAIKIDGKSKHLGFFIIEEEAAAAYQRALKSLNNN